MDHARQNPHRHPRFVSDPWFPHFLRSPGRCLTTALLALLLIATAGCQSTAVRSDGPPGHAGNLPAVAGGPTAAGPTGGGPTAAKSNSDTGGTASSDTKVCGTPPCMRFVSRSETQTIADTVGAHPFLSSVATHLVVGLLCGGILCLLGEGVGVAYVGETAKHAAAAHECLRVSILPNGHEWRLVDVTASNQSPYCTD
jgi:hypothetical protein